MAREVLGILETLHKEARSTLMMVTHDALAASYCDRVLFIKDGRLQSELKRGENKEAFYQEIIQRISKLEGSLVSV
ncbi:hypothetical protein [Metabacillus sp. RGM 3146]|uniref:hypothetical protein n=1 Tax=Metabacillus sp. RGM 3146 TaxID=3401092 RepID=UPI003B9BAF6A